MHDATVMKSRLSSMGKAAIYTKVVMIILESKKQAGSRKHHNRYEHLGLAYLPSATYLGMTLKSVQQTK